MLACVEVVCSSLHSELLDLIYLTVTCVFMQVGESLCIDPKILQAVSDTLKEALGKQCHFLYLKESSRCDI